MNEAENRDLHAEARRHRLDRNSYIETNTQKDPFKMVNPAAEGGLNVLHTCFSFQQPDERMG